MILYHNVAGQAPVRIEPLYRIGEVRLMAREHDTNKRHIIHIANVVRVVRRDGDTLTVTRTLTSDFVKLQNSKAL